MTNPRDLLYACFPLQEFDLESCCDYLDYSSSDDSDRILKYVRCHSFSPPPPPPFHRPLFLPSQPHTTTTPFSCHDRQPCSAGTVVSTSSSGSDLELHFTTDSSVTNDGFRLLYQITPFSGATIPWDVLEPSGTTALPGLSTTQYSVCSTSSITGVMAGVIFSHLGYGRRNYNNDLSCTLTVYPLNSDEYLHFHLDEVDLEGPDDLRLQSSSSSTSVELSTT